MVGYSLLVFECLGGKTFHILVIILVPSLAHLFLQLCLLWCLVVGWDSLSCLVCWRLDSNLLHLALKTWDLTQMLLKSLSLGILVDRGSCGVLREDFRGLNCMTILVVFISVSCLILLRGRWSLLSFLTFLWHGKSNSLRLGSFDCCLEFFLWLGLFFNFFWFSIYSFLLWDFFLFRFLFWGFFLLRFFLLNFHLLRFRRIGLCFFWFRCFLLSFFIFLFVVPLSLFLDILLSLFFIRFWSIVWFIIRLRIFFLSWFLRLLF